MNLLKHERFMVLLTLAALMFNLKDYKEHYNELVEQLHFEVSKNIKYAFMYYNLKK